MRVTQLSLIGLVAVACSMAAQAQQQALAKPQPTAASSAAAKDCTKPNNRHDHGMEKGEAPSIPNPCTQAQAASAPTKLHDHAQVHK